MADFAVMEAVRQQLDEYFSGQREGFDLPIDVRGTAFREKVWRALHEIPYGVTYSYGQLAEAVGCRGGQRAVAQACSANRLAILVPCHRVVAANGSMGGYTISHSGSRRGSRPAGLAIKEYLLNLERTGGQ